jgi:hypothetical protein
MTGGGFGGFRDGIYTKTHCFFQIAPPPSCGRYLQNLLSTLLLYRVKHIWSNRRTEPGHIIVQHSTQSAMAAQGVAPKGLFIHNNLL